MLIIARVARLSGDTPDDEDFEDFHETVNAEPTDLAGRMKVRPAIQSIKQHICPV